jgi:hypothetical protein
VEGIGIGEDGEPVGLVKPSDGKRVAFLIPSRGKPAEALLDSMEASCPLMDQAGYEAGIVFEVGNPYISAARSLLLRKALDWKADHVVFIDDDVSWRPQDLIKLLDTSGEVIAGTYRFKGPIEEYMGLLHDDPVTHRPEVREDGCVRAELVPAGFLKLSKEAVGRFMRGYPELCYGAPYAFHVDLFNHGAFEGRWWGEDYMFSKRWRAIGGELWIVPDMELCHWGGGNDHKGNFHEFLLRQPGGSKHVKKFYEVMVA